MATSQEQLWASDFGKEYTERNNWESDDEWDRIYLETWGLTKLEINNKVMNELPRELKILEVGCNFGAQLRGYQRMGFSQLFGVELQTNAVEKSKKKYEGLNIISGSGFDIPFKDGFFDLVCTNGVLIHISPDDHVAFMKEIHRCSRKYIMGWEYYSENLAELPYRGRQGYMWKGDYAKIYLDNFGDMALKAQHLIKYNSNNNRDAIFLLEKEA